MTFTVQHLNELDGVADQLLKVGQAHAVWLLDGPMGAGKTTLVKALCRRLGVINTVQSPTFSIVNEYVTADGEPIYHFDCYRLKNEAEAFDIGIEEYFDSGALCLVEWPERIVSLLPAESWTVQIRLEGETRIIEINE